MHDPKGSRTLYGGLKPILVRVCAAVLLFFLTQVAAFADVRALLIGNSAYTTWPKLPGAARDVGTFHKVLVDRFKVAEKNIRVVDNATKTQIEAAIAQFTTEVNPGDTAVFYYSGHGAVCLDDTGTDPNGLSECIVGIDAPLYDLPGFDQHVVRNSWFENAIVALKKKVRTTAGQGHVLLVFDSCHSGSISRGSEGRFRSAKGIRDYFMKLAKPPTRPRTLEHAAGHDGWVLLAACRAEEEASDDKSFTQYLAGVLGSSVITARSDYVDVMQQIGTTDLMLYQSPQAEGDLAVPLLGGTAQPRQAACVVHKAYDEYVELDQGTLVGFTPKSKIALYKPGTHSADEKQNKIAEAVIEADDASPFKVIARLTSGKAAGLKGAVAFLTDQVLADASLKVWIDPAVPAALFDGPLKNSVERVTSPQQAMVLVKPKGSGVVVQRLSAAGGVQAVLYDGPLVEAHVVPLLKTEARRLALMALATGDDLSVSITPGRFSMKGTQIAGFQPDLGDAGKARGAHLQGTTLSFNDGEQAEVEVTNHGGEAMYVTLLYFNARGQIDVIYPAAGQAANWSMLEPEHTLRIPMGFSVDKDQRGHGDLVEAFKVIGTREKIDTTFLRTRGGNPKSPFERLLGDAADGAGRRGASQIGVPAPRQFVMGAPVWVHVKP